MTIKCDVQQLTSPTNKVKKNQFFAMLRHMKSSKNIYIIVVLAVFMIVAFLMISSTNQTRSSSTDPSRVNIHATDLYPLNGEKSRLFEYRINREEFFTKYPIYKYHWEKRRQVAQEAGLLNSINPFDSSSAVYLWDYFLPSIDCPYKQRIGRMGDGGKWTCLMPELETKEDCVVYSFGVNYEVSFEVEIAKRTKCQIYAFDYTVSGVPEIAQNNPKIHFYRWGLGAKDETLYGYPFKTLPSIMKTLGHTHIDILKVDIEGSEWQVFEQMNTPVLADQLLIELHLDKVEDVFKFFEKIEQGEGFIPFMNEINLYPIVASRFLNVNPKPYAIEYSLLKPKLIGK